jgi:regulator of replication initiation timing
MLTILKRKRVQRFKQDHIRQQNTIALQQDKIDTLNGKVEQLDRVGAETYKNMVTLRAEVKDLTATKVALRLANATLKEELKKEEQVTAVQAKEIEELILEITKVTANYRKLCDVLDNNE